MRVNLYEELDVDPRFDALCSVVPKFEAYGALVNLWKLGMAYWKKKGEPQNIPGGLAEHLVHFDRLLAAGFVRKQDDGSFYCAGAAERWKHLREHQERNSRAGKASAEARRAKNGSAVPINASNSEQKPNSARTPAEQKPNTSEPVRTKPKTSTSSSTSSSGSKEKQIQNTNTGNALEVAKRPTIATTTDVWNAYRVAYAAKYRAEPTRNAKVNKQISDFCKRVPIEEAPDIVRFFLNHPSAFYVSTMHSFGACLTDAEKLRTQWLTQFVLDDSKMKEYRDKASEKPFSIGRILAEKAARSEQTQMSIEGSDDSV